MGLNTYLLEHTYIHIQLEKSLFMYLSDYSFVLFVSHLVEGKEEIKFQCDLIKLN